MSNPDETPSEPGPELEPAPFFSRFPPPLTYIVVYVIGLAIHRWLPIWIIPESYRSALAIVGGFLVAIGLLLAGASFALFLHRRTTVKPHGEPVHLIDIGPFIISRNPMYLSLTLIYVGAAVWQAMLWPLILVVIPVAIVNSITIPFEERRLRTIFGPSYEEYCRRVRRWI